MAYYNYNAVPPPDNLQPNVAPSPTTPRNTVRQSNTGIDIDAWTISALQSLSVSPVARGTGTPLAIPIDERTRTTTSRGEVRTVQFDNGTPSPPLPPRRPPSRRDSMVRREALLKGKEGSRQRRRWENDRLIGVPNAQPPEPADWEVKPTHPIRRMPYQLAQFWDRGVRQLVEDKTSRLQATRKKQQLQQGSATGLGVGEVPRDLRESAKRSPVVKSWVRALEDPVRQFIFDERERMGGEPAKDQELDSEDEEIVFAGRSAVKQRTRLVRREADTGAVEEGMVFDSFGDDESASYKRWLTHSISDYYGLESRSVTLAHTSTRVVYVGFKQTRRVSRKRLPPMPRPLWELC